MEKIVAIVEKICSVHERYKNVLSIALHFGYQMFLTCFCSIQISQYQVFAVHKLSHMMGWNVLSYSFASSSHQAQVFGTNPSILISSHDGAR